MKSKIKRPKLVKRRSKKAGLPPGTLVHVGEKIESMEEDLVGDPSEKTLHQIHSMKREMIFLRKSVWPLREVVSGLQRSESSIMQETTGISLKHQQQDERGDEGADNHRNDIYPVDFCRRRLWDEFRAHAGIEMEIGLRRRLVCNGVYGDRYVNMLQKKEVVVN